MGIFDKAKDAVSGHEDQVNQGIDKAGDMVDERTGGQHAEQVDKAQDFTKGQFGGGAPEGGAPAPEGGAPAPEGGAPEAPQP